MPAKRVENRGQWTIKHTELGPEFQTLVRMAAERSGMTVGSFVVETLRERATGILKGEEEGTPRSTPARLEDVADALGVRLTEAVERLRQEQAEAMAEQRRLVRRGRWRR